MSDLWTVWIEYEEPKCGCKNCPADVRTLRVTTYSARAVDEAGALERGEEIARGKGDLNPCAYKAQRMESTT